MGQIVLLLTVFGNFTNYDFCTEKLNAKEDQQKKKKKKTIKKRINKYQSIM